MTNQALVSIIIPTFNRAHLIGETLDSVLAQTYTNWECIVVDDGSTDGTSALMETYCAKDFRFQYHHRPKNRPQGGNAARNYGFELSKGDYVNWFDSDDLMDSNKLLIQVEVLVENPDIKFCVSNCAFFNENSLNVEYKLNKPLNSNDAFNDFVQDKIKFYTPSLIVKRTYLSEYNLKFDEALFRYQEYDFFCKMLYISKDYICVNRTLTNIRVHVESISLSGYNSSKTNSIFMAHLKILENYKSKLSKKSRNHCIRMIQMTYSTFLVHKDFENAKRIKEIVNVKNDIFSRNFALKVNLSFYSYCWFGRGEKLLKS
ncbi:glycosyltransferase family 2 protein [Gelidibacter salicanalis]|uniref:Glycosyltransferase family 2 protein n=1 Tax=Gelidibacter salicanalis TaxID=291193 RepID=A0A5C7AAN4_9FLAO|nr:glycosyltransferase family 2 protein [Gelidibacter salicanalis]TXE05840.1 glycosyltransferase family 2 protein [Gelidibacter salicanalis]